MQRLLLSILILAIIFIYWLAAQPGKPSDVLRGKPANAQPKRAPRKLSEQERRESVMEKRIGKG